MSENSLLKNRAKDTLMEEVKDKSLVAFSVMALTSTAVALPMADVYD
jgi:hypothetical protein